jgi:hypothetical protein
VGFPEHKSKIFGEGNYISNGRILAFVVALLGLTVELKHFGNLGDGITHNIVCKFSIDGCIRHFPSFNMMSSALSRPGKCPGTISIEPALFDHSLRGQ